ncbi:hypothetical protein [Streptomyces sp. NPDC059786]|uniref:hypothetical protein n=1 Tax=Streptomyces sp. NPDC059786 TaxID=3346946 RepID=UPI00364E5AA3
MDPQTYAKLYGPWRPDPSASAGTGVTLLTALLGAVTAMSLAWLTFLVGLSALWGAADGAAVGGFLASYAAGVAGYAALLTALALVPGVRRMTSAGRRLLLTAVACLVPFVLAVVTWFSTG